jgi:serine protease Do
MGPGERVQRQTALGTGFIIDPDGFVVTNEHVVHDATEVKVKLSDEREFPADVVGRDPRLDLALLRLKGATGLPYAPLGSSEVLRVGEHVLAVGNPFGLGHTVTLGIVSAKARSIGAGPYDDFIQTDASINPGNSGGPLFNWRGEVVGINTAIRAGANGIGFAIPSDALKNILPQLRQKGFVERGKLGVVIQPITSELATALGLESPRGALIADLEPTGAGAKAGLKSGDVIVAVNGTPIPHFEDLPRTVAKNPPGATVTVAVLRGKEKRDVKVTLDTLQDPEAAAARPSVQAAPPQSADKLGIQISEVPGGVRVDRVASPSSELRPGDLLIEFNGKRVLNVESLREAIASAKPGSTVVAKVKRGGQVHFAAIVVPGGSGK